VVNTLQVYHIIAVNLKQVYLLCSHLTVRGHVLTSSVHPSLSYRLRRLLENKSVWKTKINANVGQGQE